MDDRGVRVQRTPTADDQQSDTTDREHQSQLGHSVEESRSYRCVGRYARPDQRRTQRDFHNSYSAGCQPQPGSTTTGRPHKDDRVPRDHTVYSGYCTDQAGQIEDPVHDRQAADGERGLPAQAQCNQLVQGRSAYLISIDPGPVEQSLGQP